MTLSLRHFSSLPNTVAIRRDALAAQLAARVDALECSRDRHRHRLSRVDQQEIQHVLDRGRMDLRKEAAILVETTRYVDRFHHHILRKLAG